MRLENFSALFFDLDGTLLQGSDAHYEKCVALVFQEMLGIHFTVPRGSSFRYTLKEKFPDLSSEMHEKIYEAYRKIFFEVERTVELFPDAENFLERTKFWKRSLVTNCNDYEVEMTKKFVPLDQFFSEIIFRAPRFSPKPAPDMYLEAAKNIGVLPENCLVFEDSEAGIFAGKNAGMTVCALDRYGDLNRAKIPADFWVSSFNEIA